MTTNKGSINKGVETFIDNKAGSDYSSNDEAHKDFEEEVSKATFVKSEAEKRLVRKINYTLLPFIGAIVFIQV